MNISNILTSSFSSKDTLPSSSSLLSVRFAFLLPLEVLEGFREPDEDFLRSVSEVTKVLFNNHCSH